MNIRKISLIRNADFIEQSSNDKNYPYWEIYSAIVDFGYVQGSDPSPYVLETFFGLEMSIIGILKNPDAMSYFYDWIDSALPNHKLGNGNAFFLKKDEETLQLFWDTEFYGQPLNGEFPEIPLRDFRKWLETCQIYAADVQKFFREGMNDKRDLPIYNSI